MGRPPHSGGTAFRFTSNEVVEMEACLQEINNAIPGREVLCSLAEKFSASAERAGKIIVQPKQVWNWFQNRRYAQRAKLIKSPVKLSISPMPRDDSGQVRNVTQSLPAPSARSAFDNSSQMEFEAKSARDGAWYDVANFISHRMFETGDPEVRVRFAGFGAEEDEWVNVRRHVRQRSLPCEASECVAVLPGDLILCFQEGKEQALYFDAHVLDAQRRRHDVRGCRCRFLVRYDHDQSEEIVPLRKVCRRPETDYRLQQLHALKELASAEQRNTGKDPSLVSTSRDVNSASQRARKQRKVDENTDEVVTGTPPPMVNTDEVVTVSPQPMVKEPVTVTITAETASTETMKAENASGSNTVTLDAPKADAALTIAAVAGTGNGSGLVENMQEGR
ncbi:protein SAWADEE HOMEODOMAIN HOMOLOG 2 isoform X2 [Telopea speciosissima]|uniref:protein SAWADEE HOMEODOMAIN HOMOLOG 2 isoform X2 n=1 Tax=Telopea speciosissima TaxID=54955 RepID=UPI001CC615F3|nr:protein SAWADEE HOMEODOMAIN HOMOLOG 2 isoform X2 [Telopea speciosissima]